MVQLKVITIIDKWPLRIKRRAGEEGAVEEYLEMHPTGWERYAEWHYKRSRPSNVVKNGNPAPPGANWRII